MLLVLYRQTDGQTITAPLVELSFWYSPPATQESDSLSDALPNSEELRSVGADAGRPSANVTVPTRTMAHRRKIMRSSEHHST